MQSARVILLSLLASGAAREALAEPPQATTAPTTMPGDDAPPAASLDDRKRTDDARRRAERRRAAQADAAPAAAAVPADTGVAAARPSDLVGTVARLDDRDPDVRWAARSSLMALTRADLPKLRDAVAGSGPNVTTRAALRDVVLHVYLTGKHNFAGRGETHLGVWTIIAPNEPPTVRARTIGYDAYRVLRDGDVIVALRAPPRRGASEADGTFVPIPAVERLQDLLRALPVGEWVSVRVIRDGEPVETRIRIGLKLQAVIDGRGPNPFFGEALDYWRDEFAPAIDAPAAATRPAGG